MPPDAPKSSSEQVMSCHVKHLKEVHKPSLSLGEALSTANELDHSPANTVTDLLQSAT